MKKVCGHSKGKQFGNGNRQPHAIYSDERRKDEQA